MPKNRRRRVGVVPARARARPRARPAFAARRRARVVASVAHPFARRSACRVVASSSDARRRDFDARMATRVAATPATPRVARRRARRAAARSSARASARDDDGDDAATLRALADARASPDDERASRRALEIVRAARASKRALGSARTWNWALSAAARAASEEDGRARAREVWGCMRDGKVVNDYTLDALARGLCRGSRDVRETLRALREATSLGATMNSYALATIFAACKREQYAFRKAKGKWARDESETMLEALQEAWDAGRGYHNGHSLANAMRTFQLCDREDRALEIFKEGEVKELDAHVLRCALQSYAAVEGLKSADDVYRRGKKEGVVVDVGHLNTLLYAAMESGDHVYATKMFDDMVAGAEPSPDVQTLVYVLSACAKAKEADVAMEYFERGLKVGIDYDIRTIDALLKSCAKSGRVVDALEVFMDATAHGIKVRDSTITLLLSAYQDIAAQPGQLQQALTIVDMGLFLNVEPTERMVKALLRLCVAGDDLRRGREELRKACARGVRVTCSTLSILAEPYAVRGDIDGALDVIRSGKDMGIELRSGVFIQCVSARKARGDGDGALVLYKASRDEFHVEPSARIINELFDALGRKGMWEEALRILSDDVLSVDGVARAGFSETAVSHLVRAFINAGELEQGAAALEIGKMLTNSANKLAEERLRAAQKRTLRR